MIVHSKLMRCDMSLEYLKCRIKELQLKVAWLPVTRFIARSCHIIGTPMWLGPSSGSIQVKQDLQLAAGTVLVCLSCRPLSVCLGVPTLVCDWLSIKVVSTHVVEVDAVIWQ